MGGGLSANASAAASNLPPTEPWAFTPWGWPAMAGGMRPASLTYRPRQPDREVLIEALAPGAMRAVIVPSFLAQFLRNG
jgi:hypothetical protein